MTQLDTEVTPTEFVADRCDVYRIALKHLSEFDWGTGEARATPHDALMLAQWFYGDGES